GDIRLQGSKVQAGGDISLTASGDITAIAAVNTQYSKRDEKQKGSSLGVGIAVGGEDSGFKVNDGGSFSREREQLDGSAWQERVIEAGKILTVNSCNDVKLIGGQLKGDSIKATIGGDLTIQSLQDSDNYDYD